MDDPVEPHIERFAHAAAAPAEVIVAQTGGGAVVALDGATGEPLWRWATRDPMAGVAHGGERVYVSAATSGRPAWVEVDAPPDQAPITGPHVHPLAHVMRIKVRSSAVTTLRASDGSVLWRVTLYSADSAGPVYLTGAVVITQVLSFASQAREVIAIDAATGALRWSRKIGALGMLGGASAPRLCWVADGKVAVSMDAEVGDSVGGKHPFALFDAATGALTWRGDQAPTSDRSRRRATFGDITFSFDYQPAWPHTYLRAVRNDDGAEVWRVAWDGLDDQSPMPMGLLTHEGQVYLLSHRAHWVRIHALHAATGQIMWRWRSPRWLFALFLLRQALQRIREARRNRTWRSFWSDALHLRWRHPLRPEGEPVMDAARGRLYVATSLGVFALRMRDGRRLWHALPFVGVRLVHVPPTGAEG